MLAENIKNDPIEILTQLQNGLEHTSIPKEYWVNLGLYYVYLITIVLFYYIFSFCVYSVVLNKGYLCWM